MILDSFVDDPIRVLLFLKVRCVLISFHSSADIIILCLCSEIAKVLHCDVMMIMWKLQFPLLLHFESCVYSFMAATHLIKSLLILHNFSVPPKLGIELC